MYLLNGYTEILQIFSPFFNPSFITKTTVISFLAVCQMIGFLPCCKIPKQLLLNHMMVWITTFCIRYGVQLWGDYWTEMQWFWCWIFMIQKKKFRAIYKYRKSCTSTHTWARAESVELEYNWHLWSYKFFASDKREARGGPGKSTNFMIVFVVMQGKLEHK